jgi:hypothetical protein
MSPGRVLREHTYRELVEWSIMFKFWKAQQK